MGGISTSVGLISGIDTGSLIDQLIQISARPRTLAEQRIVQLQAEQTALLDINSRLSALRSASVRLRTDRVFDTASATASDPSVINATPSAGAALGTFSFVVDRLVSSQQSLSRGFVDRDTSSIGATEFIIEGFEGRLDRDVELADLNDGAGITRGRIEITDSAGTTSEIDLTRVATLDEVVDAINDASGLEVTASISGNNLVLTDSGGGNDLTLRNVSGYDGVLESLGFADNVYDVSGGSVVDVEGTSIYGLSDNTSLASLGDANGVRITDIAVNGSDLRVVTASGAVHDVRLAELQDGEDILEGPVTTIGALRTRIEDETNGDVTVAFNDDGNGLRLVDNTTGATQFTVIDVSGAAVDLGFVATDGGSSIGVGNLIDGNAVFAGAGSTLISNLLGGQGLSDGSLTVTIGGGDLPVTLDVSGSVTDLMSQLEDVSGGRVSASLDETGTGITLSYTGPGGTDSIAFSGALADALGINGTLSDTQTTLETGRLQHAYIRSSTSLDSLNNGSGIGTGTFLITDGDGTIGEVTIADTDRTIGDIVDKINSSGANVTAAINQNGDGIVITDDSASGAFTLKIEDTEGQVAENLNLAGEATGTGASNLIDGSFERTITFEAGATLDDVAEAINNANANVRAEVLNDGSGTTPFRLNLTSRITGTDGRFTLDTNGFDLGLTTLSAGEDSRVFFGSDDPATGVLISSSSNQLDGVISGVSIDLTSTSDDPVTLTVARDNESIEAGITEFITAFNDVVSRIDALSDFNEETEERGILLGDSTVRVLRQSLFNTLQRPAVGVASQFQYLSQVGVSFGSSGEIELDTEKLRTALEEDPQGVANLFADREQADREDEVEIFPGVTVTNSDPNEFTSLGVAELVADLVDRYIDPLDGILTRRDDSIESQIDVQNDRIDRLTDQLAREREVLERQFAAMERALADLQTQQSALLGLSGSLGGGAV